MPYRFLGLLDSCIAAMAATAFFKQAININNGFPDKVVMDKSGANCAGIENINMLLILAGLISFTEICQVNYLNNVIEQAHRFIKKIANPMMGFKAFHSVRATIEGIETAHMIRKIQLPENNIPAYRRDTGWTLGSTIVVTITGRERANQVELKR